MKIYLLLEIIDQNSYLDKNKLYLADGINTGTTFVVKYYYDNVWIYADWKGNVADSEDFCFTAFSENSLRKKLYNFRIMGN